jgi:arylsulfatase A-like enzyme
VSTRFDIFTGRWTFPFIDAGPLPFQYPVLAEVLREQGVATALITDNPILLQPGLGLDRGFDLVKAVRGQADDNFQPPSAQMIELPCSRDKLENSDQRLDQYRRNAFWFRQQGTTPIESVFREAMQWLQQPREKFFLWIDSFDPQDPWDARQEFLDRYPLDQSGERVVWPRSGTVERYSRADLANIASLYRAEVTQTDHWVGQMLDFLERQHLLEKTMLIFFGAQGYCLGEHDLLGAAEFERPDAVFEELAHVPLMMRHPGGLGAGQLLSGLAQPLDLFPTVLELLGVRAVQWTQGHSLVRRLSGRTTLRSYAVAGCHPRKDDVKRLTVGSSEWCFVYSPQGGMARSQLFRRGTDLNATRNVIGEFPDVAAHHLQLLKSWMDETGVPGMRRQQLLEGTGFTWFNDLQHRLWLKQNEKDYRRKLQKSV